MKNSNKRTRNVRAQESNRLGRRTFLQGASAAAASLAGAGLMGGRTAHAVPSPGALGSLAAPHTLIYIYLRGGADGLTLLAPAVDPYYTGQRTSGASNGTRIDPGTTGRKLPGEPWWMPRVLDPLAAVYHNGDLAVIPAIGDSQGNESHFVAMDLMEFAPDPAQGLGSTTSGFMARALNKVTFGANPPALRGLVMSQRGTSSFLRAPQSLAIPDVTQFRFPGAPQGMPGDMGDALRAMNNRTPATGTISEQQLADASETSFEALGYLDSVDWLSSAVSIVGPNGGQYPQTSFGRQLQRAALLILSGNPPAVIEIDLGGWDHHAGQDPSNPGGPMYDLMEQLGRGLNVFHKDLNNASHPVAGDTWLDHVTTMTISEFGRQIQENGSKGTDHGKGGVMFVMGGSRLLGGVKDDHWQGGLAGMEDSGGDVKVAVDYRSVFGEAFVKLLGIPQGELGGGTDPIFPGYSSIVAPFPAPTLFA